MRPLPASDDEVDVIRRDRYRQHRFRRDRSELGSTGGLHAAKVPRSETRRRELRCIPEPALHIGLAEPRLAEDLRMLWREQQPRRAAVHIITAYGKRHRIAHHPDQI